MKKIPDKDLLINIDCILTNPINRNKSDYYLDRGF